ncbi:hypothetical protein DFJ74DRAFT_649855 [Hyaloraphidium curvatum]|nr:hypothetical protein DFJ74DRAFT_649855 [Hyaloraphidium curvatum]
MYDVKNKVVVITGSGSGFGERLAKRLAPMGAKLVLADMNEKEGTRVADEIKAKHGPIAVFKRTDVSSNEDIKALFALAIERFGDFDVLVSNAGIPERTDYYADDTDDWQSQLNVNIKPVVLGARLAIDHFVKAKKKGVVVSTASLAGLYPQGRGPVYAAAKAFVVHFTRCLAFLEPSYGIRVNAVCPSYSPTNIQKISRVGPVSEVTEKVTVGRDGRVAPQIHPEQVIDAFIHAIQDETIAGQAIRITPERGIEVQYLGKKPPLQLKDLTPASARM